MVSIKTNTTNQQLGFRPKIKQKRAYAQKS